VVKKVVSLIIRKTEKSDRGKEKKKPRKEKVGSHRGKNSFFHRLRGTGEGEAPVGRRDDDPNSIMKKKRPVTYPDKKGDESRRL